MYIQIFVAYIILNKYNRNIQILYINIHNTLTIVPVVNITYFINVCRLYF